MEPDFPKVPISSPALDEYFFKFSQQWHRWKAFRSTVEKGGKSVAKWRWNRPCFLFISFVKWRSDGESRARLLLTGVISPLLERPLLSKEMKASSWRMGEEKSDRNNMTVSRDLSHAVLRFTIWPWTYKDLQCALKEFGTRLFAFTSGEPIEQLSETTDRGPAHPAADNDITVTGHPQ